MRVIFDTNVFNHLLDGKISETNIPKEWVIAVTHIQQDEINNTKGPRLIQLQGMMKRFVEVKIPTESAVWGVSRWDECKWTQADNLYTPIKVALDAVLAKSNNTQDALIAETAIKNSMPLVTNDRTLKEIVKKFGGEVIDLAIS